MRRFVSRRALVTLAASAALTIGGGGAAVLVPAPSAGASGTSHTLTGITNLSSAVEGAVKVSFTCDDVSGAFTFKASNVQVIEDDHVTRWPILALAWQIDANPHFAGGGPSVKQDKTNGLFTGKDSGTLSDAGACATGALFYLNDTSGFPWLNVHATLT
jgi:hypothetical protein